MKCSSIPSIAKTPGPTLRLLSTCAVMIGLACDSTPQSPPADTIYHNATVLPLTHEGARTNALATRDGKILATGSAASMKQWQGPNTKKVDLKGKTLMPGFVDGHGHLSFYAMLNQGANLSSPPAGTVRNTQQLTEQLKHFIKENQIPPGQLILGWGYDHSLLESLEHPTRDDLDQVSTEHPIIILHVSGHLSSANSRLLTLLGYGPDTPDPPGGVIRRRKGSSEPNGVLEEAASQHALFLLQQGTREERVAEIEKAQMGVLSNGITTAQDGYTSTETFGDFSEAAAQNRLILDVVSLPGWNFYDAIAKKYEIPMTYKGRFKAGGVKIVLDGSPQGKTAYLRQPYFIPPEGLAADYRGYPVVSQEIANETFMKFADLGIPVFGHANGDASADMFVEALEKSMSGRKTVPANNVMIHAPLVLQEHLDVMKKYNAVPSFFTSHVFYWGDYHRDSVLGPERAAHLSPTRWAQDREMLFTLHTDTPIVIYDPFDLLWTAVTRKTRSGKVLGPDQKLTVYEALRAMTFNTAHAYGESDRKGTLEPGKLADMIVVTENPFEVDPDALADISVLATFKEDQLVYGTVGED